jgi:hypothetical protein
MAQSHAARRALAATRRRGGPGGPSKPAATTSSPSRPASWPTKITHAELDELAGKHRITFEDGLSKSDKQTVLDAAGIGPED